jgi:hypothetical protein
MLMLVMHKRINYLESLITLANKEGLTDATIIQRKGIGAYIYGGGGSFVFHDARFSMEYDKAFVAVIKDRDKAKHLLDLIENDSTLRLLNLGDRAFVCIVPFERIKNLESC